MDLRRSVVDVRLSLLVCLPTLINAEKTGMLLFVEEDNGVVMSCLFSAVDRTLCLFAF